MRRLCLMILSLCMLILSGCATIDSDITIDNDGSGKWIAQVNAQADSLEKSYITEPLIKNNIQNFKIYVPDKDGNMATVKDSDMGPYPIWKIEATFDNPEEFQRLRNAIVGSLKGKNSDPVLQKLNDGNYKVDLGLSPGKTNIKVNGEIIPESIDDGTLQDNVITFTENDFMRFSFKPGHGLLFYTSIVLGGALVGGIGYIFYLRRKYYGDAQ